MKNKGFRIVNWGLWAPAAGLMRQLRFPGKMALISVAFLLPLAWLLAGFLAVEREDLQFVAQERQGVAYSRAVYRLLAASDQWRYAARTQAYGDTGVDVASASEEFDARLRELRQLSQPYNGPWELSARWNQIDQDLAAVRNTPKASPAEVYGSMTALSRSMSALQAQVTDRSGLALDPELSSYYLMSAALMRAPDIIRSTGELRGLAGGALRAGRIEPEQAARVGELRSIIAHEMGNAQSDLAKVQAADPVIATSLLRDAPAATTAFVQVLERLFPAGVTTVQGDAKGVIDLANQTLAVQYRQVDANLGRVGATAGAARQPPAGPALDQPLGDSDRSVARGVSGHGFLPLHVRWVQGAAPPPAGHQHGRPAREHQQQRSRRGQRPAA